MATPEKWRWTDDDGVQRLLGRDELRHALDEGRLRPGTLVWRKGMSSWLPAAEIPELASEPPPSSGELFTARVERPSNIIDIDSLHQEQTLTRRGMYSSRPPNGARSERSPLSSKPKTGGVDEQWDEPSSSGEDTVTRVGVSLSTMDDDDEATMARPVPRPSAAPPKPDRADDFRSRRQLPAPRVQDAPISVAPPSRGELASDELLASNLLQSVHPNTVTRALGVDSAAVSGAASTRPEKLKVVVKVGETVSSQTGTDLDLAGVRQYVARDVLTDVLPDMPIGTEMSPGIAPPDVWRTQGPAIAHEPWFMGAAAAVESITSTWFKVPEVLALSRRLAIGIVSAALFLLVLVFFLGQWSSPEPSGYARYAIAARLPEPAPATLDTAMRPCLMLRAPASWAKSASRHVPFELAATPDKRLAIGYAGSAYEARGVLVDPKSGVVEKSFQPEEGDDKLSRVTPMVSAEGVTFATTLAKQKGVRRGVTVMGDTPFTVGFSKKAVVVQRSNEDPVQIWPLEKGRRGPESLRAVVVPGRAVGIVYRHGAKIWVGWLKLDGTVMLAAEVVRGTGRKVGKPMLAASGGQAVLVFANLPKDEDAAKEVRWVVGGVGGSLAESEVVKLPKGGPGGDAIAPAVASMADGRWILMWTEGRSGNRVLRAQTYDAAFRTLGDALRVSPGTGNFGQGTVGVSSTRAAVAFLLSRGRGRYELWGTVLQCD